MEKINVLKKEKAGEEQEIIISDKRARLNGVRSAS